MKLILTCEHARNMIPTEFRYLFENAQKELNSHRGFDPGALDLFNFLKELAFFGKAQMVSRLLVEMNRSLNNPELFSEFTKLLAPEVKKEVLNTYYFPYRHSVEDAVRTQIEKGEEVLHVSVHSFVPELNGKTRDVELGLLFDPKRSSEKEFCVGLKNNLRRGSSSLHVKFNKPYLGTADGFTTCLRKKFPKNYLGIELEVNQKFVSKNKMDPYLKMQLYKVLKDSF
ncbi:MAG TPA: N-formylglutamate amidohydrolase [Salinimicrobium sp.]|nr:N-formylglutamate amidohydrolase [Salinimicrobium sp.]